MKILSFCAALFLLLSCDTSSTEADAGISGLLNTTSGAAYAKELAPMDVSSPEPPEQQDTKIIKTAHLDFETDALEETHARIMTLVQQYKGTLQNDNSGKDYRRIFHQMTIRVPSQHFDALIAQVSDGVAYFERRDISQRDVTEEFVDIKARLKAKRELENRYLQLLKQAKNVKEMLEIERQLALIREEIESRQGRLQYLQSQVAMSTVYLNFYKTSVETGVTTSYGQKMKQALQSGWQGISYFFLGLLTLWPLLIMSIICILLIRKYIKKRRKKKK